ncbi:MAG: chemotaxis protein CheD [Bryobacteraceae bacterium]|jgi:chemotaxis protein CheD
MIEAAIGVPRKALPEVDIQPGELYLTRRPMILATILGSCIGITFRSARLGAAAMCHGVLPRCPKSRPPDSSPAEGYRYVDFCIRHLARQFDALGAGRDEIEVKVFGGADVISAPGTNGGRPTVGALNCQAATEVLALEGFTVLARDIGGVQGRKIHFHTGTGEVLLRRLAVSNGGNL